MVLLLVSVTLSGGFGGFVTLCGRVDFCKVRLVEVCVLLVCDLDTSGGREDRGLLSTHPVASVGFPAFVL